MGGKNGDKDWKNKLSDVFPASASSDREVPNVCMYVLVFSVKRRLRTADRRLRTRGKMQTGCKMQIADQG